MLSFLSFGLFAQQQRIVDSLDREVAIKQLEEVVVTDARIPLKRSQSGKPLIKINAEQIASFQGLGLSALLNQYAGISVVGSHAYAGQNKTVSLRGGRNRQVLVLIDGVRVSDPSRIDNDFDINYLNLGQIESIEIIKGASSALYGSSAATGVINITTKKTTQGFHAEIQSNVGTLRSQQDDFSIAHFQNYLQLGHGGKKIQANSFVSKQYSDGMSAVLGPEKDPYDQVNAGVSLHYNPNDKLTFLMDYEHAEISSAYDNSFALEDARFQFISTQNKATFSSNYEHTYGTLALRLGYQSVDRDFQSDYPFTTQAHNTQVDLFNTYSFGNYLYSVVGALFQKNTATYDQNQQLTQFDIYANFVALFSKRFRINFGSRWNNHNTYGNHFTYQANPSFQLLHKNESDLKIFTSVSTAFIAPSLYQLYDPYSGNETLQPEENQSFEAGMTFSRPKWSWSMVHFRRTQNPSLIYDLSTYRYENMQEKAIYYGWEIEGSGKLAQKLNFNQNITFTQAQNGDLRYLPRLSSHTYLNYAFNLRWSSSIRLQMIGERFGLDRKTILEPYQLLHLSFQRQWTHVPLTLHFHITNLLNANYIEIEGYSTRGRNAVLGVNYLFH